MNVLIVDDDPMTRVLLRRVIVREFNCDVSEAGDGRVALEIAGATPPDLVISDIWMPVMDGIEMLEALRQFPPLAAVPVVMMTAARETEQVHRAIELGVTDYLLKPLQAARVAERLRAVVEKITRRGEAVDAGGRVVLDDRTPLLVADGNADFRHFVVSTVGGTRPVHQAATGVAALQRSVELRPGLILVGADLGVLGPELLMRKLRGVPELGQTRLVAIVPKQGASPPPAELVDDVVPRTFVADDFRAQFDRAMARMREAADAPAPPATPRESAAAPAS